MDLGGEQVEGRQAVAALLSAGRRRVRDVWITKGQDRAPVLDRILTVAGRLQVPVKEVSRDRMEAEARTEAPQGVLAHAAALAEADFDELVTGVAAAHPGSAGSVRPAGSAGPAGAMPFVLALDGVTDPHNMGALLRSAEAAGATGAVIPRRRAVNVTPTVAKAAAGAIEYLDLASVPGLPSAVSRARDLGCWVVGLHAEADRSIYEVDPALAEAPLMLVVGSEGKGLSELVRRRCDLLLRIPMSGATESLNVSVAGAVALFEIGRRRHPQGPTGASGS